jgi:hypothetical protein
MLKGKFLQNYSDFPIFPSIRQATPLTGMLFVTTLTSLLSASAGLLLGLLLSSEDGGHMFLLNVWLPSNYFSIKVGQIAPIYSEIQSEITSKSV